jgi:peptidoglycan/LPS O-acetylase OafA/YrhL
MNRNLDCHRAFAVLLVLAGHAAAFSGTLGPYGPFRLITLGGLGVLLFFVHTSLVLMQSLEREPGAAGFYVRRIFRIYPLAIAAMLLVMIFRIPQASISVGHFAGFSPDFGDVLSNLALMQNFSMRAPVLGPTWSLSYELQMYVLLPALFALITGLRRALILYAATVALALGVNHYSSSINLLSFAPCFLSGILAYRIGKRGGWTLPAWGWPVFIAALAAAYVAGEDSRYKDYGLCLALGLGIPRFEQITFAPFVQAGNYIAKYSFGIYLTHFATLHFAFERLSGRSLAFRLSVFAALAVTLPVAAYHAIEEPCVRLGKRITRKTFAVQPSQRGDVPRAWRRYSTETTAK